MSVEDALPAPTTLQPGFPAYAKRPGFAEIKPHNVNNIHAGLAQIRTEFQRRALPATTATPADPPSPPVEASDIYLLTYDHRLSRTPGESIFVVYCLNPKLAYLTSKPPASRGDKATWLDGLGTWWSTGDVRATERSLGQWQDILGPTGFGSIMESIVRGEFFRKFGQPTRHTSTGHRPSAGGVDVHWLEVAEFLHELASELASELREAA